MQDYCRPPASFRDVKEFDKSVMETLNLQYLKQKLVKQRQKIQG